MGKIKTEQYSNNNNKKHKQIISGQKHTKQ